MSNTFVTSWTVTCQAPLSIGFPRQEYKRGLPFTSLRDLSDPGIKPMSPALAGEFFTTGPTGKPKHTRNSSFALGNFIKIFSPISQSSVDTKGCLYSSVYPFFYCSNLCNLQFSSVSDNLAVKIPVQHSCAHI